MYQARVDVDFECVRVSEHAQAVVELGAGAALPSLVAAVLGASSVVATDYDAIGCEAAARSRDVNAHVLAVAGRDGTLPSMTVEVSARPARACAARECVNKRRLRMRE